MRPGPVPGGVPHLKKLKLELLAAAVMVNVNGWLVGWRCGLRCETQKVFRWRTYCHAGDERRRGGSIVGAFDGGRTSTEHYGSVHDYIFFSY